MEKGRLCYDRDTYRELLHSIKIYNSSVPELRHGMKLFKELEFGYKLANPLLTLGIAFSCREQVFRHPAPAWLLLIIYAAVFAVFALGKREFLVPTAATAPLLLLDLRFAILLALNFLLYILWRRIHTPLKEKPGYPDFLGIKTIYRE